MSLIGCIADDYTGATDSASALVRRGLRVVQFFGVPSPVPDLAGVDAVVVALRTRSAPKEVAVQQSIAAVKTLLQLGCVRFLFKYCSTFDSTPEGNIGPVTEALMQELGCEQVVLCPAFPLNGRTQYQGHLFVGQQLLSESGMRHHPLTPMEDPNLVRVLEGQSTLPVGLIEYRTVRQGESAISVRLQELLVEGRRLILTDALTDEHLNAIAHAIAQMRLVTGGAAIGGAMVDAWRRIRVLESQEYPAPLPEVLGNTIIFSGSCSPATQRQVRNYALQHPARKIDLFACSPAVSSANFDEDQAKWTESSLRILQEAVDWAVAHAEQSPLIYTTVEVAELHRIQQELGPRAAATRAEMILASLARRLVNQGFRRMIVAGGETAGAIVRELKIQAIRIGPEISPGVPWTQTLEPQPIALALKSGNFGSENFFWDAQLALQAAG